MAELEFHVDRPNILPGAIHSRMSRQYVALDHWEPYREIITRLYQGQNKTLRETMDIMAREYGLFATCAEPSELVIG